MKNPSAKTATGVVESPCAKVSALLLDVRAGAFNGRELPLVIDGAASAVLIEGGPKKFTVLAGESTAATRLCFIEVDQANHCISTYGGWWFKSEYAIEPHHKGSLLTCRLFNAATGVSGMVAGLLHRRELMSARPALERMLQKLETRLGCVAYLAEA